MADQYFRYVDGVLKSYTAVEYEAAFGEVPTQPRPGDLTFGGRYPGDTNGTNEIDFITIATEGNAQDFGDLTDDVHESGALASQTRGINFGGETPSLTNVIEFVTIASTGNASDFGDLAAVVGDDPAGISDSHGGLAQ